MRRRSFLAITASLICTAVMPKPLRAIVIGPAHPCGCLRKYPHDEFENCFVHDEEGRRWDSYTAEEVASLERRKVEVQTGETEWSCYCGDHDDQEDTLMPVGTRCFWKRTSYEVDEWECQCVESNRRDWLWCQTTDFREMAAAVFA